MFVLQPLRGRLISIEYSPLSEKVGFSALIVKLVSLAITAFLPLIMSCSISIK